MNDNPYTAPDASSVSTESEQRVYRDDEDELLDNSTAVRCLGFVAISMGCLLGYDTVYVPLRDALAGARSLYLPSRYVGASVGAVLGGVIMLIAGRHTRKFLMHRWYNATPLNIAGTLSIVAIAIFADLYFESLLAGLGYVLNP